MGKILVKIIAVLISTAAVYVCAILIMFALGKINWLPNVKFTVGGFGHTLLRMQEAKREKEIDVLFVGSSHAYRGFDTRMFEEKGIKTFNLGTNSQSPFISYYLLKEHLPQLKPKVIVVDLFWGALSLSNVEAGVDIISNSEINENIIDMALDSRDIMLLNCVALSSVFQYFNPLNASLQQEVEDDIYVKGGFVETLRKTNIYSDAKLSSIKKYKFVPADIQLEYLRKVIALCRDQNAKLVFVVTPVTNEYLQAYENYEEYYDLVQNIAKENNAVLVDYNKDKKLNLDTKYDFYDTHHLSQSGVVKFNNLFLTEFDSLLSVRAK